MFYKNISLSAKTFYGIEFKPGQVKEVPGYISSPGMIAAIKPVEPPKPKKSIEQVSTTPIESKKQSKHEEETSNGTDNH